MSTKKVLQVRTRKGKKKTHQHVENETNNIVTCLIHKYGNMDQEYWIQNAMLYVATQHNELNTHTKKNKHIIWPMLRRKQTRWKSRRRRRRRKCLYLLTDVHVYELSFLAALACVHNHPECGIVLSCNRSNDFPLWWNYMICDIGLSLSPREPANSWRSE